MFLTLLTFLPEIMAMYTSDILANLSKTPFVSKGNTARSGWGANGANVPS